MIQTHGQNFKNVFFQNPATYGTFRAMFERLSYPGLRLLGAGRLGAAD